MKNIVIVGFMGTGKTVVAKTLAGDMGKTYVSVDALIEVREGKVIGDIFRDSGEAYFREVEKSVIEEVSEKHDQVVDAGGGVVLDAENMENLKKSGIVICLWAEAGVIHERTKKHAHRPLLKVANPEERIRELLDYRRPFYEKADFRVDTTDLDIASVVGRIKEIVNEAEKEKARSKRRDFEQDVP
ncbi:MAG: shikimate kinase [Candidatus Omnitrophota bacterium]